MFSYDPVTNVLTISKIPITKIEGNGMLDDIKQAYNDYIFGEDCLLAKDVQFLFDKLCDKAGCKDFRLETKIKVEGPQIKYKQSMVSPPDAYYEVFVSLRKISDTVEENVWSQPIRLLSIPYMDARGVINVKGSYKTLVNYLTPSQDITYDDSKKNGAIINLYLGTLNLPILIKDKPSILVKVGNKGNNKFRLDEAIYTLLAAENSQYNAEYDERELAVEESELLKAFDVIHNSVLTPYNICVGSYHYATAESNCGKLSSLIFKDNYKLSKTIRHNLNSACQLDRALGYTLSRDVVAPNGDVIAKAGTLITETILREMKRNLIWKIYVKHCPVFNNIKLAENLSIPIKPLTKISKIVREMFGSRLDGYNFVPDNFQDLFASQEAIQSGKATTEQYMTYIGTVLKQQVNLKASKNTLNNNIAEFLYNNGNTEPIRCRHSTQGVPIDVHMDIEIITNKTFRASDLPGKQGDFDTWYTLNSKGQLVLQEECDDMGVFVDSKVNVPYRCFDGTRLNSRDLLAIYSIAGWYIAHPNTRILLNKDTAFLKDVGLFGTVFSSSFRAVAETFWNMAKTSLRPKLNWQNAYTITSTDVRGLDSLIKRHLTDSKSVESAELLNPASVLGQVTNISTHVNDKNSVTEQQRLMALPFYGRICPYETPASQKIGLVNHKAIGCRIVDGQLKSAFRRVYKNNDNAYIIWAEDPVWLTARDQSIFKITDILSANVDPATGNIPKATVLAAIPNSSPTGDNITVEPISTLDLDFVSYLPEQHCSATALLMPFIGSDDPARISFGLSMQKQAIFCQENQTPRVITTQYQDIAEIFTNKNSSDTIGCYTIHADGDGRVLEINEKSIKVEYTIDAVSSTKARLQIKVTKDEWAERTDLQVGKECNAHTALFLKHPESKVPFNCKVVDIKDDGQSITATIEDIGSNKKKKQISIKCQSVIIHGQSVTFMEYDKAPGERFKKGDILAHASIMKNGIYSPSRNVLVAYMPTGYNYEDAVQMSADCAAHYTSISMRSQDITFKHAADESLTPVFSNAYIMDNMELGYLSKNRSKHIGEADNNAVLHRFYADKISGYYYTNQRESKNTHKPGIKKETYTVQLLAFNNEKEGDKMAGRHGNKGVLSKVTPNSKMPMLKNGKIVDVLLNPCGVPSRMNLGQNLEAHLGFIAEVLDVTIVSDPFNGATQEDITRLLEYVHGLANSDPSVWRFYTYNRGFGLNDSFVEHIMSVQDHIKEWEGVFNKNGEAEMWDPVSQRWFEYPITFGYAYFMKLEQQVDEKINAREGFTSEQYQSADQQPTRGRSVSGGQKMGEMELVTLAAHAATAFTHEITNAMSDNTGARYKMTAEAMGNGALQIAEEDMQPRSNYNLRYLLEAMGIYTDITPESGDVDVLSSIAKEVAANRVAYNKNAILGTMPDNIAKYADAIKAVADANKAALDDMDD